eukprot:4917361-Pleurochrysis_carterae.AAC.1
MAQREEEEWTEGCLDMELKAVIHAHDTQITTTTAGRPDEMNDARGPIHCAIQNAIQIGKNKRHNAPGKHATPNKHATMNATFCPILNSIQCAIYVETAAACRKEDRETHAKTNKAWTPRYSVKKWTSIVTWMLLNCCYIGWIKKCGTSSNFAKEKATKKMQSKADERKTRRRRKLKLQRRQTQTRIRNWQTTRKLTYDGKNRRKYRNKVRASKRWLQQKYKKEAEEAINRERRRRTGGTEDGGGARKGGAGRKPLARPVYASSIEEGVLKSIGVPQNTWGDGSCWLWAVAGALGMLEGMEGPTDKDIRLEREWRGAIRDTVRERGIPMTEDDINGLNDGVQYEQGRLIRGGSWGGGTEHQALAIILNINIVIWDRRHIGRVGAQHKQIYICSPTGQVSLKNIAQMENTIHQSQYKSIHLL